MYVTEYISLASQGLLTEYLQCYTQGLHVYHSSDTILELVLNIPEDARNLPSGEKQSVWTDPCNIGKTKCIIFSLPLMLNILIINSQQTYQLQMSIGFYTCTFEKFKS